MSYATLTEVKSALSISDTDDDTLIQRAIDAAVELVDEFTSRSFGAVDTAVDGEKSSRVYTPKGRRLLIIDDAAKIDSVEERHHHTDAWETVDADDYLEEPVEGDVVQRIHRVQSTWPPDRQSVRVTAWFGWAATPDRVKQATIMQAERIFKESKEAPLGVVPFGGFDGTALRMMDKLHPQVEVLLASVKRGRAAAPEVVTLG